MQAVRSYVKEEIDHVKSCESRRNHPRIGCRIYSFHRFGAEAGDMTIGVMAGVNYATVHQDPEFGDIEFEHKLGLLAGAFLDVALNDVFSIEPEVLYSQKGTEVRAPDPTPISRGA